MSKNCSSSSSSSSLLRLHQQKNKNKPAIMATPATQPMTIPAMLPPDKELEPESACLFWGSGGPDSEEDRSEAFDLTVVVTSTTELALPLGFAVAVDMNVLVLAELPWLEDRDSEVSEVGECREVDAGASEVEVDEGVDEVEDDVDVDELEDDVDVDEDEVDVDDEDEVVEDEVLPPTVEASASALT